MKQSRRRAFVMIELAALLAVVAVVACLLLVLGRGSRHNAWQAGSIANLHEFAAVTASYQADYEDQFWSYTWRANWRSPSQYPDLQQTGSTLDAIVAQGTDIIRRRGRADMAYGAIWLPTFWLHHLPLADYLDRDLMMRFAVSPGDRNRGVWTNDPEGFFANAYVPNQPPVNDPLDYRMLYSSSYHVGQAFFCPDAVTSTHGTVVQAQDWGHFTIVGPYPPTFDFGGRRVGEVAFPSQKVHAFDTAQWQGVRAPVFFLYPFARAPVLMVDGSAHVRITSQANAGFRPDSPRSPFPTVMPYNPNPWEPPLLQGVSSMLVGAYSWTRGGLTGRDFDGQEIPTASW